MTMRHISPLLLCGTLVLAGLARVTRAQTPAKPDAAVPATTQTPATPDPEGSAKAQTPAKPAPTAPAPAQAQAKPTSPAGRKASIPVPGPGDAPADFVIGPDDVLTVIFWREKDLSGDVVVRPDGRISIPLLNDVQAAGLTPDQLRAKLIDAAAQFLEDPNATVIVKEIHSRRVFITGQVSKPGSYVLTRPTTVIQLISMAGGLLDYADQKQISVMRIENGKPVSYAFNYKDVANRKNLQQNIELVLGDTVVVP